MGCRQCHDENRARKCDRTLQQLLDDYKDKDWLLTDDTGVCSVDTGGCGHKIGQHTNPTTGPQDAARSIFGNGIPRLYGRQGKPSSGSGAAQRANHEAATSVERQLDPLLKTVGIVSSGSSIWKQHAVHGLNWQTETTIVRFVTMVVQDVIEELGLGKIVQIHDEITVTSLRPDLWVIVHKMIPIGLLEVKVPAEPSPLGAPRVLGQVLDYLQMLRSFYYCQHAIGIVTTYNEWMVCWLDEECFKEEPASTPHTPSHRDDEGQRKRSPPKPPSQGTDVHRVPRRSERLNTALELEEPEERKFFSSRVFSWNHDDTVGVIARAIQEMVRFAPDRAPMEPKQEGRLVIKMTKGQWSWVKFPRVDGPLPYGVYPTPDSKEFLLLEEIGRSDAAEGHVWLACDTDVAGVCVLKFSKDNNADAARSRLTQEARNWATLYPSDEYAWCSAVRVVELDSRPALLMPHFSYVPEEQRAATFIDKIFGLYKDRFLEKGYVHEDLRWANMAAVKNDSGGLEPFSISASTA